MVLLFLEEIYTVTDESNHVTEIGIYTGPSVNQVAGEFKGQGTRSEDIGERVSSDKCLIQAAGHRHGKEGQLDTGLQYKLTWGPVNIFKHG